MGIQWRDEMAIGHEAVDKDHRYLIGLINTVEKNLDSEGGFSAALVTLDLLWDYTKQHFIREEEVMTTVGYSGLNDHRKDHHDLISQLAAIRKRVDACSTRADQEVLVGDVVKLLRHWLLNHIIKKDLLIKPFLKANH